MPGPRIYTKDWERLKVAAKETEFRETPREVPPETHIPREPKHLKAPRLSVVAIGVLAVLTILTASLWIDSQARIMTVAGDLTDFKNRLALLQEKMKKTEDEKQRLEEENKLLSTQYEQKAAELAQLEDELTAARSQKDKSRVRPKQAAATDEKPALNAPDTPKAVHGTPPVQTGNAPKLQKQEQQDVKAYKID